MQLDLVQPMDKDIKRGTVYKDAYIYTIKTSSYKL